MPEPVVSTINPLQEYFAGGSLAYIIGINAYQTLPVLKSTHNDCRGLEEVLSQKHGFTTHVLLDAGKNDFLGLLEQLKETVHTDSRVVFYFAGHGIADGMDGDNTPSGFILPADAIRGNHDTYIPMTLVMNVLEQLPCRHLMIILDCCYAGAFRFAQTTRSIGDDVPKTLYRQKFEFYASEQVKQVITSAACDQKAVDSIGERGLNENNRSPFAESLIQTLINGDSDLAFGDKKPDGIITGSELGFYLSQVVSDRLSAGNIPLENQQTPSIFRIGERSKGEFVFVHSPLAILSLEELVTRNPYKGLIDYAIGENSLFYGRQRALYGWWEGKVFNKGLLTLVQAADDGEEKKYYRIVVTGRSGSGKSSLVKAGVLSTCPPDAVHSITPGKTPFTTHHTLLEQLQSSTALQYLLVDQYEELLTICTDAAERESFENLLCSITRAKKVVILITIRSDIERRFTGSPFMGSIAAGEVCRFIVPSFTREEVKEIVMQPAAQFMLEFRSKKGDDKSNEAFVNSIIDDTFSNPDAMPLLSFALARLYEKRDGVHLTEAEYENFGGITGILDNKFTEAYDSFKEAGQVTGITSRQQLFKQAVYRMISFDAGTMARRRVYTSFFQGEKMLNELEFNNPDVTANMQSIIDYLVKERLLKAARENDLSAPSPGMENIYVEPSHEALLRSSGLLAGWQNENLLSGISFQNKILLLRSFSAIAQTWYFETDLNNKKGLLWKEDPRLAYVQKLVAGEELLLNKTEQDFMQASVKARERAKRLFRIMVATAFAFITAALVIFLFQNKNITKEKGNALAQKSIALNRLVDNYWENSLKSLRENDYVRYWLLLAEAIGLNTDSARNNLFLSNLGLEHFNMFFDGAYVLKNRTIEKVVAGGGGRYLLLGSFAYDPNNLSTLATTATHYDYTLWDTRTHRQILTAPNDIDLDDSLVIIGNRWYFMRGSKKVECWNLDSGKLSKSNTGDSQYYRMQASGKNVVFTGDNNGVYLLDSNLKELPIHFDDSALNWVHPDGHRLLSYSFRKGIFSMGGFEENTTIRSRSFNQKCPEPDNFYNNGTFSPSGNYFLYLSAEDILVLLNLQTGQSYNVDKINSDAYMYARYSPDDQYLIYFKGLKSSNGRVLRIPDKTKQTFDFEISNYTTDITFFPSTHTYRDSFMIVSVDTSWYSNVEMFSLSSGKKGSVFMRKSENSLAVTLMASDGRRIAFTDVNTLKVADVDHPAKIFSFPMPNLMPFHQPKFLPGAMHLLLCNMSSVYAYRFAHPFSQPDTTKDLLLWTENERYEVRLAGKQYLLFDHVQNRQLGNALPVTDPGITDIVFSKDGMMALGVYGNGTDDDTLLLLNFRNGKSYPLGMITAYYAPDDGEPMKRSYVFSADDKAVLYYSQRGFYSFSIPAEKKELICELPDIVTDTSEFSINTDGTSFVFAKGDEYQNKLQRYVIKPSTSLSPVTNIDIGPLPSYGSWLDDQHYLSISSITMMLSITDFSTKKVDVIAKIGANKTINQVYISKDKSRMALLMDDEALQVIDLKNKTVICSRKIPVLKNMFTRKKEETTVYLTMDADNNTLAILSGMTGCFLDIKTGIEDILYFDNPYNESLKGYFRDHTFYYYLGGTIGTRGTDLDIPAALFRQQAIALTGARLNAVSNQPEVIPEEELPALVEAYNKAAEAHYRVCRYKTFNLWKKLHPEIN